MSRRLNLRRWTFLNTAARGDRIKRGEGAWGEHQTDGPAAMLRASITKKDRDVLLGKQTPTRIHVRRLRQMLLIGRDGKPTSLARHFLGTGVRTKGFKKGHWPKGKRRTDLSAGEVEQAIKFLHAALKAGMSQNEIGRQLGVHGKTISVWVRRVMHPTAASARKIMALEVPHSPDS